MPEVRRDRDDPFLTFRFVVQILNQSIASDPIGFSSVSGLEHEMETMEVSEIDSRVPFEIPIGAKVGELTLERGQDGRAELLSWYKHVNPTEDGRARRIPSSQRSLIGADQMTQMSPSTATSDIHIFVRRNGEIFRLGRVKQAWPKKLKFSDLRSSGAGILIHTLTLSHRGFVSG